MQVIIRRLPLAISGLNPGSPARSYVPSSSWDRAMEMPELDVSECASEAGQTAGTRTTSQRIRTRVERVGWHRSHARYVEFRRLCPRVAYMVSTGHRLGT